MLAICKKAVYRCRTLSILAHQYNWEFKIYQDQDIKQQTEIRKQIRELYIEIFGKYSEIDFNKALQDEEFLKRAKKLYEKLRGKINQSSIVLYHGPKDKRYAEVHYKRHQYCPCGLCYNHYSFSKVATLLTGDIDLTALCENGDNLKTFIDDVQCQVGFFQIPHHGSRNNTSVNLLKKIFPHPMEMICCYGRTNKFNHPDAYMLDELMNSCFADIYHVVENNEFTYEIELRI